MVFILSIDEEDKVLYVCVCVCAQVLHKHVYAYV